MTPMNVMVSEPTKSLVVPHRTDTQTLFPHARPFEWKGDKYLQVPHRVTEARLLRNMGIDVPSPILSYYDWRRGKPFAIQKDTANLLTMNPRSYVLSGMGTGKTRAVLWAADYLMQIGEIRKVLVLAPLSTLHVVWRQEIMKALMGRRVMILHGTKQQRLDLLAQDADFYIINHDGVSTIYEELYQRADIDLVVIDELSTLRNPGTARWKVTNNLVRTKAWVWGLTGSPTPQAPSDAWGQAKLITPERVPGSHGNFKDRVMQKVSMFTWAPRPDHAKIVADTLRPSVRFKMEDVVELPEVSFNRREVAISPQSAKAYKDLLASCRALIQNGASITAVNEGVMVNKLLQVSCGLVYDDAGGVQDLGAGDRYQTVTDCLDATERKVIVFVPYLHAMHDLTKRLRKDGYDVEEIYGDVAPTKRNDIFMRFETTPFIRVIVAHPRTMAHGITLVAANTIIWYSPAPSFEIYEQANARIRRPGQKHKQLIMELAGTPAEKQRYRQLRNKESMQGSILRLLEGTNEE